MTGALRNAPHGDGFVLAATHPFVAERISLFTLAPGEQQELVILADVRGAIYAISGVLPRKQITIPREFLDGALHRLRPTFRAGPLLALPQAEGIKPALPQPEIEGMRASFMHGDDLQQESPFAPRVPLGELPRGRALLAEGWVRLSYYEDDKES